MKITKEQFKNIVRETMIEENEYQEFFKKALEKTGKSIPDMSDEEKKAFFNKIDAAWDGKGEKNEGNAFGAAVSNAKEKGEDEFEVDGEKFKVEEANTTSAPGEWVAYLSMTRGKKLLNTFNTARGAKQFLSKNVDKLLGGANVESVGIMSKKQWDEREAKYAIEGVNESLIAKDGKILLNGKLVGRYDYDRGSSAFWTTDLSDTQFRGSKAFDTKEEMLEFFKKYISRAAKALEYEKKSLAKFGIKYPNESVNEASKPTIKVVNKFKNEPGIQIGVFKTTDGDTMYGGFVVRGKLQKVIPAGANNSKEGVKKRALQIWDEFGKQLGESVNEANSKDILNQIEKLRVAANSGKITGEQFLDKFFPLWKQLKSMRGESVVNEEKYTVIDPKGNQLGTADKMQVVMAAKKKGGEKAGYFVVSAKNALKARRALEKFKGDFKNPKLKDMMADLYENKIKK